MRVTQIKHMTFAVRDAFVKTLPKSRTIEFMQVYKAGEGPERPQGIER